MQPEDNNIDKPDDFSQKVGEKLRKHSMPVRSGVWEALSGKLPPGKKSIPAYWLWTAAGVAAVVAVLFLISIPLDNKQVLDVAQTEILTGKETDIKQIVEEKSAEIGVEPTKEEMPSPNKIAGKQKITKPEEITKSQGNEDTERMVSVEKNGELAQVTNTEEALELEKKGKPEEGSVPVVNAIAVKTPDREETVQSETEVQEAGVRYGEKQQTEKLLAYNIPAKKYRMFQSLAAALGSGSSLPYFVSFDYGTAPQYDNSLPGGDLSSGNGPVTDGGYHLLAPSDYTNIEHRLPITFNLTADLQAGKDVSLETGLSYTYLFSRFSRNDQFIYRGTLQQHYLGIPVNLRYTVWKKDAWNIYLLVGGSVEKGLRAIYKQEIEHNGEAVYHTNVYSRISGFQLSAQGGAGFGYRLHDNIYLFGEPRLIYYFKNNQPMSARTDNPLIFGLNLGVRIRFNSE